MVTKMFLTFFYRSQLSVLIAFVIGIFLSFPSEVCAQGAAANQSATIPTVLDLIYRQKYDNAITRLEEILEEDPRNGEALTLKATANLYQTRDFFKAQNEFEEAYKAGGGATFFVTHSHEVFTTGDVVDYCRGWLHLRKDVVEFAPTEGMHGFKLKFSDVEEFKRNRFSKTAFHVKADGKSYNFLGRSNNEFESLLIVALYNNFTRKLAALTLSH
jgi:tetratricopeptide (TPR) repeat protein